MRLSLPYPAPALWPNKRPHHMAKARAVKAARNEAFWTAKEAGSLLLGDGKVPVKITVHGKPTGPLPDEDNVVASCKAYLDGIAMALGVDDKIFAAPTIAFAAERKSRFIVEIGHG